MAAAIQQNNYQFAFYESGIGRLYDVQDKDHPNKYMIIYTRPKTAPAALRVSRAIELPIDNRNTIWVDRETTADFFSIERDSMEEMQGWKATVKKTIQSYLEARSPSLNTEDEKKEDEQAPSLSTLETILYNPSLVAATRIVVAVLAPPVDLSRSIVLPMSH